MAIIITKNGKNAEKISSSAFINEDNLQGFIYENPDSIPLYEIDENIRLLILAREFPTETGSIDAVGIDEKGGLYIIETKLYKNPDKRQVVAQVLDYGASLSASYNSEFDFFQILEKKVYNHFNVGLSEKIGSFFGYSIDETTEVTDNLRDNLLNGRFRFVVLMDRLEKRLKDLISFLNRNCSFDIYGVEFEFYKYESFEITIPKLFGAEIIKEVNTPSSGSKRKSWNKESFFEKIKKVLTPKDQTIVEDFYNFLDEHADKISWGSGSKRGSFNPKINKICPRSILTVYTDGSLQLNYGWIYENETQKKYIKIFSKVFSVPQEINKETFPSFPISEWSKKIEDIKKSVLELISI